MMDVLCDLNLSSSIGAHFKELNVRFAQWLCSMNHYIL
jgi:hypothetical protein